MEINCIYSQKIVTTYIITKTRDFNARERFYDVNNLAFSFSNYFLK